MGMIKKIEQLVGMKLPREARKDIRKAIEFYRKFNWREPERIEVLRMELDKNLHALYKMGEVIAIIYMSDKDGEPVLYVHVFQPPFPGLYGKGENTLIIHGGKFFLDEEGVLG